MLSKLHAILRYIGCTSEYDVLVAKAPTTDATTGEEREKGGYHIKCRGFVSSNRGGGDGRRAVKEMAMTEAEGPSRAGEPGIRCHLYVENGTTQKPALSTRHKDDGEYLEIRGANWAEMGGEGGQTLCPLYITKEGLEEGPITKAHIVELEQEPTMLENGSDTELNIKASDESTLHIVTRFFEGEEREAKGTGVVQRREAGAAEEGLADCGMDDSSVGSEDDRTTTFDARGDEDEWLEERVEDSQIGDGALADATPLEVIARK
ncbi:hypothetical protein Scep_016645 [Stephania cephalantha]|uniref:Uncharacterized protein n=1 Tax=Stephania cephalantha TaxID=152367 RepID=A0AAP0NST6_9MAGN